MLNLVEPQSSGIGGGGFLLFWDKARQQIIAYDGRETAPAHIRSDVFLDDAGQPKNFFKAVLGGQSVGVPSLLAMLAAAHKKYGRLPWRDLFQPTIERARQGFPISPRLAQWIKRDDFLKQTKARQLFFDKNLNPRRQGEIIKNPAFAETLEQIAEHGSDIFYQGMIADHIVQAVGGKNRFSKKDMTSYRPKQRDILCRSYRRYQICAMPPPSSGGITLLQILGMAEHFDLSQYPPNSVEAIHLISEASRLAYADRGHYIADPDFFAVPIEKLLAPDYLKARAQKIKLNKAMKTIRAGKLLDPVPPSQDDRSAASTTHLSIIDQYGNAVALTSSIEGPFGSHIFVDGFFLNNELTDFSFRPQRRGRKIANAVQGGKRPLSSMTPTLIFAPDGSLFATLGSPGGKRIIAYVAQTIIALIDWQMPMQAAIDLPRHVALGAANRNGDIVELEPQLAAKAEALAQIGHRIKMTPLFSGLHGVRVKHGRMDGGADPHRDGAAMPLY